MSEGISGCPDGEYSDTGPDQTHHYPMEASQMTPEHQETCEAAYETNEQQILHAIGKDNHKKNQKATNPLTKNKESKPENPPLGAKPTGSKITKNVQKGTKSNTTLLVTANTDDWIDTTNIKESLITNKENRNETADTDPPQMDIDQPTKHEEPHHHTPPPPFILEKPNKDTIIENILMNTIASNKKIELLYQEIRNIQEQNAELQKGLTEAYKLIKEIKKAPTITGRKQKKPLTCTNVSKYR